MIRAVVLDFDGLVIDTEAALIDAHEHVHRVHGVPFDRGRLVRSVGHADYAFDPWQAFDPGADRPALDAERQLKNRELGLALRLLPGVGPLIDAAVGAGLSLAVASNSGHAHVEGHLSRLGIRDRFSVVACREDVASPKPEPDLYRFAVNRLGRRPSEAVAFEDSGTGLLAAKRAGLWAVAVPNAVTADHDFSTADLRVGSLAEIRLPELIERFTGLGQPAPAP
jgi:putative hydrolase of the HAD superfamily